jgi:hypothetical protein
MFPTRTSRIAIHHSKIGPHVWCQVNLVNHQESRSHDTGTALSRYLITLGNIYYVYRRINQFRTEGGGEVVTAAFDYQYIEIVETTGQHSDRFKIHGRVLTDSRMRTPTRFNAYNAIGIQHTAPRQELRVFAGIDIVCDNRNLIWAMHPAAQPFNKCCLARSYGASNPDF